jgi:putative membrane protein
MMWGWGGDWGMGWGFFGLMHVLWWVVLIVAAVLLFRGLRDRGEGSRDRALDILRERYARGEIDQAEFAERKRQLRD